jgi:hypothetical protein
MPFKSKAQRAYLAINKPGVAKKFAKHSGGKGKALPAHVAKPVKGKNSKRGK